jgi:hypothetical protein
MPNGHDPDKTPPPPTPPPPGGGSEPGGHEGTIKPNDGTNQPPQLRLMKEAARRGGVMGGAIGGLIGGAIGAAICLCMHRLR